MSNYQHLDPERDFDFSSTNAVPLDWGRMLRDLSEAMYLVRRCQVMSGRDCHDEGVLDVIGDMIGHFTENVADSISDEKDLKTVKAWREELRQAQAAYNERKAQREQEGK